MANDGYLRSVPSDTNPNDGRLYDPTVPDSSGYTLTADGGSYALSGTDATLLYNRLVVASGSTYATSGTAATLKYGRLVTATGGTYTLSGTAATFTLTRVVVATSGSYALSGSDATLALGRELIAASGTYSLSGTDAGLTVNRILIAAGGSYSLSGTDATFQLGRSLDAESGSYSLTGSDATLTYTPIASEDDGAGAGGKRTSRQSPREPTVYVPLTKRDIEAIYPPVRVQSVVTPTLAPVTAPAQAKTLDPGLVLALFAAFDEDF